MFIAIKEMWVLSLPHCSARKISGILRVNGPTHPPLMVQASGRRMLFCVTFSSWIANKRWRASICPLTQKSVLNSVLFFSEMGLTAKARVSCYLIHSWRKGSKKWIHTFHKSIYQKTFLSISTGISNPVRRFLFSSR